MPCSCVYKDKSRWGPIVWNLIHNIPLKVGSLQNISKAVELINNMYSILPCPECRNHMIYYLENNKIIFNQSTNFEQCRKDLALYLYNFHNYVNQLTGKLPYPYTKFESTLQNSVNFTELEKMFKNSINKKYYSTLEKNETIFVKNFINSYKNL